MNFLKFTFLFLLATACSHSVWAQEEEPRRRGSRVIDDTTKQIHGPKTSKYYFEDDVFMNREIFYPVDTIIRNFHRFEDVKRNNNMYQDLGVVGSAIRPIYYEVPDVIGVSSGFHSYDVYWNREQIKQWDTKSPYTNMNVIIGGRGRSVTRATYSRHVNPRWVFGATYRGMFIDKQISRQGKGDRAVRGQYYDFYSNFQSKDSTYRVFVNFRRNNHETSESGGVRNDVPGNFQYPNYFTIDAQPWLIEANNKELRTNYHLFHQYKVGRALQVYHKMDRYRQTNRFVDKPASEPDFDYVEIDSADTNDKIKFSTFRNEFGIKGSLSKLFYNGYYAIRDYTMSYTYDTTINNTTYYRMKGVENYLGGRIALQIDSLVEVTGWGEVLQDKEDIQGYRIEGKIRSKWFDATLKQAQYAPSFLHQYYRASHDFWVNNFDAVNTTQLSGALHYRSKVLNVSPGATLTRVGNYIYFKRDTAGTRLNFYPKTNVDSTDVLPFQDTGENAIFSPTVAINLVILRHINVGGSVVYTTMLQKSEADPFRIPELLINGQIAYENIFFNGNLDMHAGVDIHWKSPYYGLAFDVPTQQFYLQADAEIAGFNDQGGKSFSGDFHSEAPPEGRFQTPSLPNQVNYPVVDVFFNAKIKRGRVFFKYNNILQAFTKVGYFPTPLYPGQRNTFDFGFDWSFYD